MHCEIWCAGLIIGFNINVLQQTACLVVNPITVGNFDILFNCTPVGRTSDSMMVPTQSCIVCNLDLLIFEIMFLFFKNTVKN